MSIKSPEISVSEVKQNESKTLRFLPGLNDEHRELLAKLEKFQKDIIDSEWAVNKTESETQGKNAELIEANGELGEKNNRISEINTQVWEKQNETKKNEWEIGSISTKIADLKKKLEGGGTAERLEAVSGPNNQVSATKESPEDIQKQIDELEWQKNKLLARNETLKQEISALQTEQKPLIARAEELQKTIIPALQAEITRLVEVKKDQEEQKNKLIVSKNETEAKNSDVATQIESQEKEIARVQVAIAESQTLYQENSEREQLERPQSDFFERMWAGIFA